MSTIEKDELYANLRQFLRGKGVELAEGSYAQTIQKSCRILADVINMGQTGIERAKTGIDQKLEQVRQCIHEKTAPRPPKGSTTTAARAAAATTPNTTETDATAATAGAGPKTNGTARKARAPKAKSTTKGKTSGKPSAKKKP